jgi:hypothetical protein
MAVTHLKLPLEQAEYTALLKIAGEDLRNPVDQARFLLRKEFERRGLLAKPDKEMIKKLIESGMRDDCK